MGRRTPILDLFIQFTDRYLVTEIFEATSFRINLIKIATFLDRGILGEVEEMWRTRMVISRPFVEVVRNVVRSRVGTCVFEIYDDNLLGKTLVNLGANYENDFDAN